MTAIVVSVAVLGLRGDAAPRERDYGHMHMLFEKTFLGFDVARVDVWVDTGTRDRVRNLAAGQGYSDGAAERIARTMLDAQDVHVQIDFLRDISIDDFFEAAHDNLARARKSGYISPAVFETAWRGTQTDFGGLRQRGLEQGDRLVYRATAGALQTVVTHGNRVLLDVTSRDLGSRRAMIASYFAPKTDFRKGLIKSLF